MAEDHDEDMRQTRAARAAREQTPGGASPLEALGEGFQALLRPRRQTSCPANLMAGASQASASGAPQMPGSARCADSMIKPERQDAQRDDHMRTPSKSPHESLRHAQEE